MPDGRFLYNSHKGQNLTADDRRKYYRTRPGRYKRDVQELKSLEKQYQKPGYISLNADNEIQIRHTKLQQITSTLNRLSFLANKGQVARTKGDCVFIKAGDYYSIIKAADIPVKEIDITFEKHDTEIYGEIFTPEERKDYHEKNPDRYRRDINFLQNNFFNLAIDENNTHEIMKLTLDDKDLAHGVTRSLNNCSYFVGKGKVISSSEGTVKLLREDYLALKAEIVSLKIQDQRKVEKLSAEDRMKYHKKNLDRKKSDASAAERVLPEFYENNGMMVHVFSGKSRAKNVYNLLQRWSYVVGKGSCVQKDNEKISILQEDFHKLRNYFKENNPVSTATMKPVCNYKKPAALKKEMNMLHLSKATLK